MTVAAACSLLLPTLETTQRTVCVTFYAHMYGFHIGELQLIAYSSRTLSTRVIWSELGQQGFQWFFMTVTVEALQPEERVCVLHC